MKFLRKLTVALLIVLISTYSFNASQTKDPDLSENYFRKGLESLKVLNYLDALMYFSKAYSADPTSYYGELSYLYIGKSYALYSYAFGSRKGILASIGYLNQYPFYYKVPRFIHTQREFVGDSYLLLQWYQTAKNIYANLYGETNRTEYMIKFGYASSLDGSVEGYNYLTKLDQKGVPKDYLDVYYMTIGFYNFNLGRYSLSIEYMSYAVNLNPYLREDPHLLFRMGVSHYKLGDWRKALLYLELTARRDPLQIYTDKTSFYLATINLETKNFREAFQNLNRLIGEDRLFYSKLAQILYSSLWYYDEFLKVYGDKLGNYRENLLKIAWLNVEDIYGELPTLGIYYLSLKSKNLTPEETQLLKVKKLTLRDFIYGADLFTFDKYLEKANAPLEQFTFYKREDAEFLKDLFEVNKKNYLKVFGNTKGIELLARSLVYLGDQKAKEVVSLVQNTALKNFLLAKLSLLEGDLKSAINLLKESEKDLKGKDKTEATLLIAYLEGDSDKLLSVVSEADFEDERLRPYAPLMLAKVGDLLFEEGKLKEALEYYKQAISFGSEGDIFWWSLFRIAVISDKLGDPQTLKWVVNKSKEEDNIWSRAIRTLWEG